MYEIAVLTVKANVGLHKKGGKRAIYALLKNYMKMYRTLKTNTKSTI